MKTSYFERRRLRTMARNHLCFTARFQSTRRYNSADKLLFLAILFPGLLFARIGDFVRAGAREFRVNPLSAVGRTRRRCKARFIIEVDFQSVRVQRNVDYIAATRGNDEFYHHPGDYGNAINKRNQRRAFA